MGLQVLNLFGILPNMLELSMNPCTQGCSYCYAKLWKHESLTINQVINQILTLETKKEGLLPFLIRKRSPISISNRTDIMSIANWREVLSALKKMGFPLYIETKLNKDYKDLASILDKSKDIIYQSVTGFNNKHEERNMLSAEEKIEGARWFNEQGFYHILAINPYLPDKVTPAAIKQMIEIVKPRGVVMREYHTTSKSIHKKYYMKEFPKEVNQAGLSEIKKYCIDNKIIHDVNYTADYRQQPMELNEKIDSNNFMFGGKHFVFEKILDIYNIMFEEENEEDFIYDFETFLEDFEEEIEYFKPCIFKRSDYSVTSGKSNFRWEHDRFDIFEFLKGIWNTKGVFVLQYLTNEKDKDGNLIYYRSKDGLIDLYK